MPADQGSWCTKVSGLYSSVGGRWQKDARKAILQAAEEIVARQGLRLIHLESAAAEAKVSKGWLFHGYRSH
jgi:AcrR family transcriptional regulator